MGEADPLCSFCLCIHRPFSPSDSSPKLGEHFRLCISLYPPPTQGRWLNEPEGSVKALRIFCDTPSGFLNKPPLCSFAYVFTYPSVLRTAPLNYGSILGDFNLMRANIKTIQRTANKVQFLFFFSSMSQYVKERLYSW